jgi:putative regulatory protein, FmdB family
MPIYEYQCNTCGDLVETIQKISDPPLTHCPSCGGSGLQKLISAGAFRLKGTGWYETDFKTSNKKNVDRSKSEETTGKQDGKDSSKKDSTKKANTTSSTVSDFTN